MSANPVRQLAHLGRSVLVSSVLGAAIVLIGGCASGPARERAAADVGVSAAPQWQVVEPGGMGGRPGSPGFTGGTGEAETVQGFVAARCKQAQARGETDFLGPLVGDLYAADVDPGTATEALMTSGCGVMASVVREMVAQGGPGVFDPVVDRALSLTGPEMEPVIAAAALVGLGRSAGAADQGRSRPTYGMAYFSTRASEVPLITAREAGQLYREALPGYGLYTFVLYGDLRALPPADRVRYDELLRVIESYVLAPDGATEAGGAAAHVFLVAVEPRRPGARAGVDPDTSAGAELAAAMRVDFAAHLRAAGHQELARGLLRHAGPFLVSSLEPRLVPANGDGPRLLVDLSAVGAEYLYGIVDAYDRPLVEQPSDPTEGFRAITRRLSALIPRQAERGLAAAPEHWVTLLVPAETANGAAVRKRDADPVRLGVRSPAAAARS